MYGPDPLHVLHCASHKRHFASPPTYESVPHTPHRPVDAITFFPLSHVTHAELLVQVAQEVWQAAQLVPPSTYIPLVVGQGAQVPLEKSLLDALHAVQEAAEEQTEQVEGQG